MKVLVTGGAGYIGCVLVEQLLEKGYAVRVFDKLYFGDEGLAGVRDKIDLVQGDLRELDPRVLDGCRAVIHLGGLSNDPTAEYNPEANHQMNTVATEVLARACKERGISRFTFASTCSIYDQGFFAEDFVRDEDSQVEPRAAYAVSNHRAERILLDLADDEFKPVCLRQGTVYGFSPRMRYDLVVNTFVKDALRKGVLTVHCGGEMWRPLVDVTDVARAHIWCLESPIEKVGGRVFNVAFKNFRILELAHHVREAFRDHKPVEIDVDYSEFRSRSYRVSTRRIEEDLGFRATVSVEDSVRKILRMIKEHGADDFDNPRYYNIRWMTLLDRMEKTLAEIGSVF